MNRDAQIDSLVRLLVERVDVSPTGADIWLRLEGLASLMRDLRPAGWAGGGPS